VTDAIELIARAVYEAMRFDRRDQTPEWVNGGSSEAQVEARRAAHVIAAAKVPGPDERENGLEALIFHRGRWRHVKWSAERRMWCLGWGGPFVWDGGRAIRALPPKPDGAEGFYDYDRR
jgi:hypothetical protein